ncbi:Ppx/GppA family phosphatase [Shewanella sp. JM162201]|uniref:Ppx/GppA family phosphatase n=1 Tax=Shewanella jiangmenensis TaxID=2837387 RepID=A0ABS5V5Y2_9GAMM|nr:Ppx/GppA phosphatase family protein [Shewanella jiangmenensis]MBT1445866.1 Ppx/GppA family phosphatase [Shewanella jiangmenensis]
MGSNSFHLMIAREQDGSLQILHKEKEQVRLAQGLSPEGYLCDDAIARGLECLRNFGQRFSDLCETRVRLVATHTLRVAKNRDKFLKAALKVIPYPIEVISGHEEARLIYAGIAQSQVLDKHNLVIDIGGGSTEVIIGNKNQPVKLSSLRCGCVSYNERFFADGSLSLSAFRAAQAAADKQFSSLSKEYFEGRWDLVLGSSGSVKAICEALQEYFQDETVTLSRLRELKLKLVQAGHVDKLEFANIERKRIPLVPAGLAILISFFRRLEIDKLTPTPAALREGVLYELAQIDLFQDIRHRTVDSIAQLYHVDTKHGAKVRDSAMALFDSVADSWQLRPHARLLAYAAMLHEIGIHINSRAHHKHGGYIIAHSDLPGFSQDLQQDLALLIGSQHKKPQFDTINSLPDGRREVLVKLLCLLRLAILVNLGRVARSLRLSCSVLGENELALIPEQSARVELLLKDLKREKKHMAQLGLQLRLDSELSTEDAED